MENHSESENTATSGPPRMPEVGSANPYLAPQQHPYVPMAQQQRNPYEVNQDDCTMGMLVHLLGLLTGFIGVLIIWLVKKDQSMFVNHHGKEALNFIITWFLASLVLIGGGLVLAVVTMGLGMFLIFPFIFLMWIGQIVFGIMACMAANRGEWHRIPLTIRLIQ